MRSVDIAIVLLALAALMLLAYRGYSVILLAPVAALAAVLFTAPQLVLPFYSGVFMVRLAGFVQLYLPVFVLGAVFGKLIEISGFARAITRAITGVLGPRQAVLAVVVVCAVLTYGGISLFVVSFSVYPFAADLFRLARIPKRLLPATIALGAFTFTMDALPGTPQIQNIIPTTFFHTDAWAAPWLGVLGSLFMLAAGLGYIEWRRRQTVEEGYGPDEAASADAPDRDRPPNLAVAVSPLILVAVLNRVFSSQFSSWYGKRFDFSSFGMKVEAIDVDALKAVWALEAALAVAVLWILLFSYSRITYSRIGASLNTSLTSAVGGALLATLNTGSEYGFGAVIALLPGFRQISQSLTHTIANPLLNAAVTTNLLAGITGSASGGMSIALAAMGQTYLAQAQAAGISPEVLHRVTAMASGGMDTLPHNGAIITLLTITGMTHRQCYKDIFAITLIKIAASFFVIGLYYLPY